MKVMSSAGIIFVMALDAMNRHLSVSVSYKPSPIVLLTELEKFENFFCALFPDFLDKGRPLFSLMY